MTARGFPWHLQGQGELPGDCPGREERSGDLFLHLWRSGIGEHPEKETTRQRSAGDPLPRLELHGVHIQGGLLDHGQSIFSPPGV